jgi:hypothetical protein
MGVAKLDAPGKKSTKVLIMRWIFPENLNWNGPISGWF